MVILVPIITVKARNSKSVKYNCVICGIIDTDSCRVIYQDSKVFNSYYIQCTLGYIHLCV